MQRTVPNISHIFMPLEDCIRNTFIPSIVGREVSDDERDILSLPVRFGGLGIANPSETANREYNASKVITQNLTRLILQQKQDFSLYDNAQTLQSIKEVQKGKETYLNQSR